ncbi:hypothetical protein [uncultured Methylobacterium sp.]|uniref:hypothetical protein n=1 Tax=uncultured Methylobacterium sp. TaxID=157278 RepID=UPI0035CCA939
MFGIVCLGAALVDASPAAAQLDTVNTIPCAQDGGICRMPHPTNVYYGVPGKTNGRPFPQGGSIPCNAQTFGDPAPGQRKSCWYAPRLVDSRRRGGDGYRGEDERSGYRGRDRDYDGPSRRPYDGGDAPRRRYRGEPDDDD